MATSIKKDNRSVTIARKDGEYRCRLFVDGRSLPECDYFTPSRTDAIATANAMVNEAKPAGVIDCTPTWESIFMIHVGAAANGNAGSISELRRMARLADLYNSAVKSGRI